MNKLTFFLILLLTTTAYVATDILLPALPAITQEFNSTDTTVQLSISLFVICMSISQLIFGSLSDKFGRRKCILTGLMIGCTGIVTCLYATHIEIFILGRCLQGIGLAAPSTLARAIVPDLFKGIELARYNAFISMGMPFVLTISPIIGGYLQHLFGWHSIFQSILVYNIGLLTIAYFYLKETNLSLNHKALEINTLVKNYCSLLTNKQFMGFSLCAACGSAGMMVYLTESSFLLQDIGHLSAVEYGWTSLGLCFGITSSGYLSSYLVKKLGYQALVKIGSMIVLLAGLTMTTIHHHFPTLLAWNVVGCMIIFLVGNTLISPNASAGAMTHLKENLGLGTAMFATLRLIVGGFASLIIAYVVVKTPTPIALSFMVAGVSSLLIYYFILPGSTKSLASQQYG